MGTLLSRRRFFRTAAGTSVGLALATILGHKVADVSAEGCITGSCNLEESPASTGTAREQAAAKAIVLRSPEFKQHANTQSNLVRGRFDVRNAIVNVEGDIATVAMWSTVKARSVVLLFWVNLTSRKVLYVSDLVISDTGNNRAHVIFSDDRAVLEDIFVSNDVVVTKTGTRFEPLDYVEHVRSQNENSTLISCDQAVTALCGLGGGAACYGACLALGLVSGPGGLGCAAVCGLIAAVGCAEAQRRICG